MAEKGVYSAEYRKAQFGVVRRHISSRKGGIRGDNGRKQGCNLGPGDKFRRHRRKDKGGGDKKVRATVGGKPRRGKGPYFRHLQKVVLPSWGVV